MSEKQVSDNCTNIKVGDYIATIFSDNESTCIIISYCGNVFKTLNEDCSIEDGTKLAKEAILNEYQKKIEQCDSAISRLYKLKGRLILERIKIDEDMENHPNQVAASS